MPCVILILPRGFSTTQIFFPPQVGEPKDAWKGPCVLVSAIKSLVLPANSPHNPTLPQTHFIFSLSLSCYFVVKLSPGDLLYRPKHINIWAVIEHHAWVTLQSVRGKWECQWRPIGTLTVSRKQDSSATQHSAVGRGGLCGVPPTMNWRRERKSKERQCWGTEFNYLMLVFFFFWLPWKHNTA